MNEPDSEPRSVHYESEQAILQVLEALRKDPKKYQGIRDALAKADSDEQRVRTLIDFATTEQELVSLIPSRKQGEPEQLAWTTVTVTTVFIADSAY